jgi:DNA-directed RNA polymerase subunit beta'
MELTTVPITKKKVLKLSKVYNIEVEDNHNYFAGGLLVGNSHITLAEPCVNPIFAGSRQIPGPAVALSGLKWKEFDDVVHGRTKINGKTGGEAIKSLLDKIDVKTEFKKTKEALSKAKGAELNALNRKAKYLRALDKLNMKPSDAYIINHVPVIPPIYRPITPMEDGSISSADINELYGLLIQDNNTLKKSPKELPDSEKNRYRAAIYDSLKAVAGMGSVPTYEGNKKLKGILQTIAGDSPKMGFFQSKIMKRRQELSMRSTITPAPEMALDQVGLPKDAAMDLYKPFVVRELIKSGKDVIDAQKEVKERSPLAWRALELAVQNRPVLLKRDPVLHKYNIQAFYPKLMEGNSIKIHPLLCAGFNADHDGDTMAAYLPVSEEARKEAIEKMLPSKNLFSSTNYGIMHAPDQEAVMGLHYLTKWGNKVDKSYTSIDAARNDPSLHINDVIKVNGRETTKGRLLLTQKLPEKFKTDDLLYNSDFRLKKKWLYKTLEAIAHHDQKGYPEVVDHLKDIGNKYAYEHGLTFSLKDLHPLVEKRDAILKPYHAEAEAVYKSNMTPEQKEAKVVDLYTRATEQLDKDLHKVYSGMGNNIYNSAIDVGGKGSAASFRQMNIAPMLLRDANNRIVPTPVTKSYAEGLDIAQYWTALHGARKGTLQKVEGTQEPGKLTKEIVNLNINTLVAEHDCKTTKGVHLSPKEPDVVERFTAKPLQLGDRLLPAGTHITPDIAGLAAKHGHEKIEVRSPMTCHAENGICQKCIGHSAEGSMHEIGTNIGVIASQAVGEPAIQLALDSFHSGGVAASRGGASVDRIKRLGQLLNIPKELPGSAVLAEHAGKITHIEKDPSTNGHYIHIGEHKHYAQSSKELAVKVGDEVHKGDILTHGPINPHQLLPLKGVEAVRNYLADELTNVVSKEGVRRRNIEVITKNLTGLAQVRDAGNSHWLVGDVIPVTELEKHNKQVQHPDNKIVYKHIIKGAINASPFKSDDLLDKLNFARLQEAIVGAAGTLGGTRLHGLNPIPNIAQSVLTSNKKPNY